MLYGWLVEADLAALVADIQLNNALSSRMNAVVYNVLQTKLFSEGLHRELMGLCKALEVELESVRNTAEHGLRELRDPSPGAS